MLAAGFRNQRGVGDEIVDEIGAHGGGIAEVADLDGRGALGKNAGAAASGVAHQVHRDVDFKLAAEFGDGAIGQAADVDEAVHCRGDARAHLVAGIRAEGEAEDFKLAAVVAFEQPGHQVGDGVVAKIRREVADADLLLPGPAGRQSGACGRRALVARVDLRGLALQLGRIGEGQKDEWIRRHFAAIDAGFQFAGLGFDVFPIADRPLHATTACRAGIRGPG